MVFLLTANDHNISSAGPAVLEVLGCCWGRDLQYLVSVFLLHQLNSILKLMSDLKYHLVMSYL